MQSQNTTTRTPAPRGGRPNYARRYQRWTPPPEPKPEPKLDLSDKNFPSLAVQPTSQSSSGHHSFQSSFTTTVKVMAEMEKLQEFRARRDREATEKERGEMRGVYVDRFRSGRLTTRDVEEPEEDDWRPTQESRSPTEDDEWTEVRHSKARKQPREKSMSELASEYHAKAADEEGADDYNGDLFESSHRHDHHAT